MSDLLYLIPLAIGFAYLGIILVWGELSGRIPSDKEMEEELRRYRK